MLKIIYKCHFRINLFPLSFSILLNTENWIVDCILEYFLDVIKPWPYDYLSVSWAGGWYVSFTQNALLMHFSINLTLFSKGCWKHQLIKMLILTKALMCKYSTNNPFPIYILVKENTHEVKGGPCTFNKLSPEGKLPPPFNKNMVKP